MKLFRQVLSGSIFGAGLALALIFIISTAAAAQPANVPVTALVSWGLPPTTTAGEPLTGGNALTEMRLYAASAAIADASTMQPTATLAASATTWTYSTSAPNGSTLYVRAKACNVGGCSAFSQQATKAVQVNAPGVPTGTMITMTVVVTVTP